MHSIHYFEAFLNRLVNIINKHLHKVYNNWSLYIHQIGPGVVQRMIGFTFDSCVFCNKGL